MVILLEDLKLEKVSFTQYTPARSILQVKRQCEYALEKTLLMCYIIEL
jgi:hypothetical protein